MFLFDLNLDYEKYAQRLNFCLDQYSLIEIETIDNESKLLRTDLSLLDCDTEMYDEIVVKAKKYWEGVNEPELNTEILFEGKFKITEIIKTKQAEN